MRNALISVALAFVLTVPGACAGLIDCILGTRKSVDADRKKLVSTLSSRNLKKEVLQLFRADEKQLIDSIGSFPTRAQFNNMADGSIVYFNGHYYVRNGQRIKMVTEGDVLKESFTGKIRVTMLTHDRAGGARIGFELFRENETKGLGTYRSIHDLFPDDLIPPFEKLGTNYEDASALRIKQLESLLQRASDFKKELNATGVYRLQGEAARSNVLPADIDPLIDSIYSELSRTP